MRIIYKNVHATVGGRDAKPVHLRGKTSQKTQNSLDNRANPCYTRISS